MADQIGLRVDFCVDKPYDQINDILIWNCSMSYRHRQITLGLLMACFAQTLQANMINHIVPDFQYTESNTVQEQTYLDNYVQDFGNSVISNYSIEKSWHLPKTGNYQPFLQLRASQLPKVQTSIGSGTIGQSYKGRDSEQALMLGFDFTQFDRFVFRQIALSHQYKFNMQNISTHAIIPFGNTQIYNDNVIDPEELGIVSPASLTSMYGLQIGASHQLQKFKTVVGADLAYYWHDKVKNNITTVSVDGRYQFNRYWSVGAGYQYKDGMDSNDSGYRLFTRGNLLPSKKAGPTHNMQQRVIGAVIAAEEAQCPGGLESFSSHGTTICSTINPFNGLSIMPMAAKDGLSTDSLIRSAQVIDGEFTSDPERLYVFENVISFKRFNVKPGTQIVMSNLGGIISREGGSILGSSEPTSETDFVTVSAAAPYKQALKALRLNTTSGIQRLIRTQANKDENVTLGNQSDYTPAVGIVFAGQGQLNRSEDADPIATAENRANDFLKNYKIDEKPRATTNAGSKTTVMKRSEESNTQGLFGSSIIGGNTKDPSQLSYIGKAVVNAVPISVIADDVVVDQLSTRIGTQHGLNAVGGKQWIKNSQFHATVSTNTGVAVGFGAETAITDCFFDMRNSLVKDSRAIRLMHGGVGAIDNTDASTRLLVANSYFESSLRKDIEGMIRLDNGKNAGSQFFSLNNLFNLNNVTHDIAGNVEQGSAGVFDLAEGVRLQRSNQDPAASLPETTVLMANYILSDANPLNIAATEAQIGNSAERLLRLSSIFNKPSATDGNYGNGLPGNSENSGNFDLGKASNSTPDLGQYVTALQNIPITSNSSLGKAVDSGNGDNRIAGWFSDANDVRNIVRFINKNETGLEKISDSRELSAVNLIKSIDTSLKSPKPARIAKIELPNKKTFQDARTSETHHKSIIANGLDDIGSRMVFKYNATASLDEFYQHLDMIINRKKDPSLYTKAKDYQLDKSIIKRRILLG